MISVSRPTITCIRQFGASKRILINSNAGIGYQVTLVNDISNLSFPMSMSDAKTLIKELELAIEEYEVEETVWTKKL